ncbi:MAG: MFS transporter [Alphaproteobacteria bacterium]|nr:MAG: MFS transporter [Alphaproteobacteria bacterium]
MASRRPALRSGHPTLQIPELRQSRFRGWSVVWVAFVIAVFGWGVGFYSPGVLLLTLHASKGWPVAMISSAITAHFLIGAALIVYLPEAHRSIGLAQTTIIGAVLAGAGIVAWSVASAPWQLFVAAAISGSGWAATSGAAINAMVAPWFDRDRPKAIGLAFNGASIGGVMFPPLLILLIAKIGVEAAAVAVGIAMLLVIIPLSVFYLRRDPKGLGLAPDGLVIDSKPHVATLTRSPRKDLIKTKGFMTLSVAFALALFAQVGLLTHLLTRISPLLGENGAAAAVSMVTTSAVLGRTLLGWTIGGRDRRLAASANFLLQSVGVVLMIISDAPTVVLVGCVLFGLGVGNVVSLPPLIAQHEFRAADVGTVVALVVAFNQAVFALAPAVLGVLRDISTSYVVPFALAAAMQIVAALIVLIRPPRRSASE